MADGTPAIFSARGAENGRQLCLLGLLQERALKSDQKEPFLLAEMLEPYLQ